MSNEENPDNEETTPLDDQNEDVPELTRSELSERAEEALRSILKKKPPRGVFANTDQKYAVPPPNVYELVPSEMPQTSSSSTPRDRRTLRFALPDETTALSSPDESVMLSSSSLSHLWEINKDGLLDLNDVVPVKKETSPESARSDSPETDGSAQPFVHTQTFEELSSSPNLTAADEKLLNAVQSRSVNKAQEAVREGADVNCYKFGETPIIMAAENCDLEMISYLLTVPNININYQDSYGCTALFVATKSGNLKIVKKLIKNGADINLADNLGATPLHLSLLKGYIYVTKYILRHKPNLNAADSFGRKPVYICSVVRPDFAALEFLLAIDGTQATLNKLLWETVLHMSDTSMVIRLLDMGAHPNTSDPNDGITPLHCAAITNNVAVSRILVKRGADPNLKTITGQTPFDQAMFHHNIEVADYLSTITKKVDPRGLIKLRSEKKKLSGTISRMSVHSTSKMSTSKSFHSN